MKKFGFLSVSLVTIMLVASTAHAEIASKAYVDDLIDPVATQISTHAANTDIHVTTAEKAEWDAKQDALGYTPENHANMVTATDNLTSQQLASTTTYPSMATANAMLNAKTEELTEDIGELGEALAGKINTTINLEAHKNKVMVRNNAGTYVPGAGNAITVANDGTITVNEATSATQDGSGNTITSTYATKDELSTATTNAANTYATQTALSDGLALKQNASDSTATVGNYISAGTGVGANLGALDTAVAANADAIDGIDDKIGNVTAGKTVVEMISDAQSAATYDDTALAARVTANEGAITTLNGSASTPGSVAKSIADAISDMETQTHASATYQTKSDSTATAGNYISAGTGVGANLGALDTATKNAKDAADAAALTANAAIPKPDEECESAANKCVLTYNNSTYYWEVIGR